MSGLRESWASRATVVIDAAISLAHLHRPPLRIDFGRAESQLPAPTPTKSGLRESWAPAVAHSTLTRRRGGRAVASGAARPMLGWAEQATGQHFSFPHAPPGNAVN
jgi:hypothetical protein